MKRFCLALLMGVLAALTTVNSSQLDFIPNSLIKDFFANIQSDRKDSFEQASPDHILLDTNVNNNPITQNKFD